MQKEAFFSFFRLFLIEAVLLSVGRGLSLLTQEGKGGWYENLSRSALTPPDWVFGVVWTILYLMIGFVAWRLWEGGASRTVKSLFVLQMGLNWGWTPIFFLAHMLLLSFLWILGLVVALGGLLGALWGTDRASFWILVPYAAWCSFASYLSGVIWMLN